MLAFMMGCATSPDDGTPPTAPAEDRAALALADPPPTVGTFSSTLPGVAWWDLRAAEATLDVVVVGRDSRGERVTAFSLAYPAAGGSDARVDFWADGSIGRPFGDVLAAVQHDLSTAPATAAPTSITIQSALLGKPVALLCPGFERVMDVVLPCVNNRCRAAYERIDEVPADVIDISACLSCGIAHGAAHLGSYLNGCL
jgi:hypothetical protein